MATRQSNQGYIRNYRNCNSVNHKHCVKGWRNLVRLWRAQKLCDVVISVKGERFHCHSIVPASVSAFFRKAFLKRATASVDSMLCDKEIIIDFMSKETFSQILTFMYTSDVEITPGGVRPLILAAGRLEMQTMVSSIMQRLLDWEIHNSMPRDTRKGHKVKNDFCLKRMMQGRESMGPYHSNDKMKEKYKMRHQDPENCQEQDCCGGESEAVSDSTDAPGPYYGRGFPSDKDMTVLGIMDELRIQGDIETLKKVQTFAARHFTDVSQLPSFMKASVHSIAALLDDDRLDLDEFGVFCALCKWLEHDHSHLVHAPYLLSKVRLQLLSPQELAEHVETKDYLMRKKKCRVNILEAFRYHCLLAQSSNMPDMDYTLEAPRGQKPRRGTLKHYDSADDDDWVVDEDGNLINEEIGAPYCPVKPCSCCPDYILASGGIDTKQKAPCEGVYKYEERENAWIRFARMPQPRNHHAAVYCKGALFIIGGSDPSLTGPGAEVCPVSACHRLGLGSLKWCKIESMSSPRMSLQGACLNDNIYAIGGQDHKQRILRDVEFYSVSRGTWEHSGSLSSARAGLAVCKFREKIWAMGGYCHKSGIVLDTVECFDDQYGDWEIMPSLRFPRCFASAAVCQGHIYVLGGAWLDAEMECSNFSSVYDVDVYNEASNVWEGITALKLGRHDAGLAVLGPRIYIVGGKHCDDGAIKNLDTVECYDVDNNDWLEGVANLPLPLLGPAITFTY